MKKLLVNVTSNELDNINLLYRLSIRDFKDKNEMIRYLLMKNVYQELNVKCNEMFNVDVGEINEVTKD